MYSTLGASLFCIRLETQSPSSSNDKILVSSSNIKPMNGFNVKSNLSIWKLFYS